jgi:hypothetical protein
MSVLNASTFRNFLPGTPTWPREAPWSRLAPIPCPPATSRHRPRTLPLPSPMPHPAPSRAPSIPLPAPASRPGAFRQFFLTFSKVGPYCARPGSRPENPQVRRPRPKRRTRTNGRPQGVPWTS